MKWLLIALAFTAGIALNVWLYRRGSPAAQHDIRLIVVLSAFMLSAILAIHGANWLLYLTHPAKVPTALSAVGLVASLALFAWMCFVVYLVGRVLWNSVT